MKNYVLNAFMEKPWAILPQKLAMLEEIVARHVAGERLSAEQIQAAINGAPRPEERAVGKVAVLPLFGTIIPRAEFMSEISGATSAESFSKKFSALVNDPEISAIVLDVNSPGGQVGGVQELSDAIYSARGQKPIIAVANHLAASAAFWIATAADELVVTPSGEVGSIGVFAAHQDVSKALDQAGVKISLISAGKYKVEGNPYEPLAEEARASIQANVNEFYDAFIAAVARNRGVNPASVRDGFGEGRTVKAQQAVALGMADSVGTLDEVIQRLSSGQSAIEITPSDRQEPVEPVVDAVQAQRGSDKARLDEATNKKFQGVPMNNLRELMSQRAELLAQAQAITETADAEGRDLNETERETFTAILGFGDDKGKVGELDAQITRIEGERAKLKAALEKLPEQKAEKPAVEVAAESKVMKRGNFDALSVGEQAKFIRNGGRLED